MGDVLVTSGLGGKFPAGYPVANISSINRDTNSGFAQVSATPTAYLERSRQVLLVWRNDQSAASN
jgi:rod shape-determining protein MreC